MSTGWRYLIKINSVYIHRFFLSRLILLFLSIYYNAGHNHDKSMLLSLFESPKSFFGIFVKLTATNSFEGDFFKDEKIDHNSRLSTYL